MLAVNMALIDVSSYPAETEVPWFRSRVVCAKCGSRGNHIDVRLQLERAVNAAEPDRQGVAMSLISSHALSPRASILTRSGRAPTRVAVARS
jgi:hypothetical protein